MKKILVIDGHPNKDSLCFGLAEAYIAGAKEAGAEVKKIRIGVLNFNPNLQYGYQKRTELEPDLLDAYEKIKWADHLVWVHPVWWGGVPAITKGFIDRLFLPGFTYRTIKNSYKFEKLLKGKTGRIIATLDQPGWFYRLYFKAPSERQLKGSLTSCGVSPVKVTYKGAVITSDASQREKWINEIRRLGQRMK